ncbi:MAG: hypothetical protein ACYTGP_09630 [Planctomycetota bacterium]|jgi:hypothetical protein
MSRGTSWCRRFGVTALAVLAVAGCTTPPLVLEPVEMPVALRGLQSRRFETTDEVRLLAVSADVLIDLGFHIDATDEVLGLVVGSKARSAVETGQVILTVTAALFGVSLPYEARQVLRASVTSDPDAGSCELRVTFQRVVWNDRGMITKMEPLDEPEMYRTFFARLQAAMMMRSES